MTHPHPVLSCPLGVLKVGFPTQKCFRVSKSDQHTCTYLYSLASFIRKQWLCQFLLKIFVISLLIQPIFHFLLNLLLNHELLDTEVKVLIVILVEDCIQKGVDLTLVFPANTYLRIFADVCVWYCRWPLLVSASLTQIKHGLWYVCKFQLRLLPNHNQPNAKINRFVVLLTHGCYKKCLIQSSAIQDDIQKFEHFLHFFD